MLRSGVTREWVAEGMIKVAGELNCSSTYIRFGESDKSEDKAKEANIATKEAKENKIDVSHTTGLRRPCMEIQSIFPSTKENCLENTKVLKQVVKGSEEAITSLEGLSYPKAKRWSK
ncbi:hypothetical protein GW17_00042578 [Ensete ventricosum]|nr:hypothetical protein GW17_00042578 [Ensete ventricosum]